MRLVDRLLGAHLRVAAKTIQSEEELFEFTVQVLQY